MELGSSSESNMAAFCEVEGTDIKEEGEEGTVKSQFHVHSGEYGDM
jgi:hypothetical protein